LHRLRGVEVGRGVFIGDDVYLENEYPELIKIGEGTAIGLRSVIIAHVGQTGSSAGELGGRVTIGKNVWIGACSFIAASPGAALSIGDGAVIGACSVIINKNVPTRAFVLPPVAQQVGTARVPLTSARSYREFLAGLYAGVQSQSSNDSSTE
jgi:acetyltransferase-like isoleucine patch superfamily enzyme